MMTKIRQRLNQKGFTLVELMVVIAILGILAATALPRFIDVTKDARKSALNGLAGGMRSAVGVVQARYFATGDNLFQKSIKDIYPLIQKNSNIIVEVLLQSFP